MSYLYREITHIIIVDEEPVTERTFVVRLSDNAFIPVTERNSDYQAFLALANEQGEENILEAAV